jgi:hypothetical protein
VPGYDCQVEADAEKSDNDSGIEGNEPGEFFKAEPKRWSANHGVHPE